MSTSTIIIMITIIAYLAMMVIIGVVFSKKNSNVGDFYLGGRKLGPIVTAMSAEASDMSSWLLMGLPGVAYLTGGAAMVFFWKFVIADMAAKGTLPSVFGIYELLPAFVAGLLVNVIVSLATKAPEKEIIEEFEAVAAEMKE
ncbi:MAG: hypothetical protein NC093_03435 [Alistipes sp.]|nr:hypothetical protein [Alistipes sp.]